MMEPGAGELVKIRRATTHYTAKAGQWGRIGMPADPGGCKHGRATRHSNCIHVGQEGFRD